MARIGKAEYPKILRAVDDQGRRVVEVAAEYGCTPANIYALMSKLRRVGTGASPPIEATDSASVTPQEPMTIVEATPLVGDAGADLFVRPVQSPARMAVATSGPDSRVDKSVSEPTPPTKPAAVVGTTLRADQASRPGHAAVDVSAKVTNLPQRTFALERDSIGAALARPGVGLLMRNADGEETLTPFRSLEDLLSAIKPLLRTVACCPDPLWFSIQPVDLAALADDAA